MPKILASQWRKKLAFVGKQTKQAMVLQNPTCKCHCHKLLHMKNAYKCLYCGQWYCKKCAEEHFGKTVAEYRNENPITEDPSPLCSGLKILPSGDNCSGCDDCSI